MCKSQETTEKGKETVENSNYGLLNISESGLGTMGLGEILMIILLGMAIILIVLYYCKKKKQQRLRELNNAMAMAYRPANSEVYPHRSAVPMVQFSTPGQRTVSLQQEPSAPAHAPAQGLWEQYR